MQRQELLSVVRTVEGSAARVDAGAGVVAADDEVIRAVVSPNQGVPHGLTWTGHAHGQRQQRQDDPVRGVIALGEGAIGPHPGVVIHVAGSRQTDAGVQQQRAIDRRQRALGELLVNAVQRVARLEGDDVAVPGSAESLTRLSWREAQLAEVVAGRQAQHLQAT